MWSFKQNNQFFQYYAILALTLFLSGCSTLKTPYFDNHSYQETTKVKEEIRQLIETSSSSTYLEHQTKIIEVLNRMENLKNYEKNRPFNTITVEMWNQIEGDNHHPVKDYFAFWKRKKILSPHFATQAKKQITHAFEILLSYELQKPKEQKNN